MRGATETQTVSPPTKRPARQLLAASVGNAVEWCDWYAYTFLTTCIAAQVFPQSADNSLVPLLSMFAVFAVFAVGFFMRPVGGLLMGAVAARAGAGRSPASRTCRRPWGSWSPPTSPHCWWTR